MNVYDQILAELRAIRRLLEERRPQEQILPGPVTLPIVEGVPGLRAESDIVELEHQGKIS